MVKQPLPQKIIITIALVITYHTVHILFNVKASFLMAEEALC